MAESEVEKELKVFDKELDAFIALKEKIENSFCKSKEPEKNEEKKIITEKDKEDFEDARRILLNLYHSYVQNHSWYLIAIIIGSLTLISRWDSFFIPQGTVSPLVGISFDFILTAIVSVSIYVIERIFYWTSLSDMVLEMDTAQSEIWIKKHNLNKSKTFISDFTPCTYKLEAASIQRLKEEFDRTNCKLSLSLFSRKAAFKRGWRLSALILIPSIGFLIILIVTQIGLGFKI